ncbi:Tobamovirus multiplication protein 1 [Zostera marina]|uniref:Tobamovirus multiplication protein 1 n=1 Tax=Zostera marina TaxID=29655 RepID=A0A0K9NR88_ZOSMR|nr:Tobamovirus multiplication protein 1 [Zostera marina]
MGGWSETMWIFLEGDKTTASAVFGGKLRSWWDQINMSEEWHRTIFFLLCGCYSFVSLVALVQLIQIQLRVMDFGWTTQKTFHFMNFIVNGLRAILFGFYQNIFLIRPKVLEMALVDFPGLLFFTTYTLLVLFWAEIYHQARNLPIDKLKPAYFIINLAVYLIQGLVWVCAWLSSNSVALEISELFVAVFSFLAALGFMIYGGRLFILLKRFPIQSRGREKKMAEVGLVTAICCICFLARCIAVAYSAFDKGADLDILKHPILNFIYYMLVEVIPSGMVLFILRKLPPKRNSYHVIR